MSFVTSAIDDIRALADATAWRPAGEAPALAPEPAPDQEAEHTKVISIEAARTKRAIEQHRRVGLFGPMPGGEAG